MVARFRCVATAWGIDESRALLVDRRGDAIITVSRSVAQSLTAQRLWSVDELKCFSADADISLERLWAAGALDAFEFEPALGTSPIVVVITANRPRACARAVGLAMRELAARSDIDGRLLIVDQSDLPRRAHVHTAVQAEADRYRVSATIARPEAAHELATAIQRTDCIAGEAAFCGLTTRRPGTTSVGAARNLANLLTLGSTLLSLDDDVAGPVLCAPYAAPAPLFGPGSLRIQPLEDVDFREWHACELLESHVRWLGGRVGHRLPLHVALTVSALRGDCGAEGPWAELTAQSRPCRLTRQVFRGALQPAITLAHQGLMCYAYGAVNDGRLPPFPPIGRNEDGVFSGLVGFLRPEAVVCHVPVTIVHDPVEARSDRRYKDIPSALSRSWRTNDLIAAMIERARTNGGSAPRADRLVDVFARLSESLANGAATEYDDLRFLYYQRRLKLIADWVATAAGTERRHILASLDRWRDQRHWDAHRAVEEWADGGWASLAAYLQSCGRMIHAWPRVCATINELSAWRSPWTALGERQGIVHVRPR